MPVCAWNSSDLYMQRAAGFTCWEWAPAEFHFCTSHLIPLIPLYWDIASRWFMWKALGSRSILYQQYSICHTLVYHHSVERNKVARQHVNLILFLKLTRSVDLLEDPFSVFSFIRWIVLTIVVNQRVTSLYPGISSELVCSYFHVDFRSVKCWLYAIFIIAM